MSETKNGSEVGGYREALLEMRISDKCREEIDELMLIDEELEELQNDNNNSQI